jgi:hypothetical protein
MTDPLQAILQPGTLKTTAFPLTSRYHGIDTETIETSDGKTVIYLRRRFLPPPERFALLQEHTVVQGDRVDNLANQYVGDPEQFWRMCDANNVMRPDELTETIGRRIRVTLPEGIPGNTNA